MGVHVTGRCRAKGNVCSYDGGVARAWIIPADGWGSGMTALTWCAELGYDTTHRRVLGGVTHSVIVLAHADIGPLPAAAREDPPDWWATHHPGGLTAPGRLRYTTATTLPDATPHPATPYGGPRGRVRDTTTAAATRPAKSNSPGPARSGQTAAGVLVRNASDDSGDPFGVTDFRGPFPGPPQRTPIPAVWSLVWQPRRSPSP